jgi:hypothetical protein
VGDHSREVYYAMKKRDVGSTKHQLVCYLMGSGWHGKLVNSLLIDGNNYMQDELISSMRTSKHNMEI